MRARFYTVPLGIGLAASLAGNAYLFINLTSARDSNPDYQARHIVAELKKTTAVPNENPSVVTVVDRTKLTNPLIAKDARNGDKILFFQNSARVMVYRPSTRKLVNILNLATPGSPTPTPAVATATPVPPTPAPSSPTPAPAKRR